jgi:hypothetical protein
VDLEEQAPETVLPETSASSTQVRLLVAVRASAAVQQVSGERAVAVVLAAAVALTRQAPQAPRAMVVPATPQAPLHLRAATAVLGLVLAATSVPVAVVVPAPLAQMEPPQRVEVVARDKPAA